MTTMQAANDRRNAHRDTSSTGNIWTPDAEVKVGYMRLRVVKRIPTPGDGKPDKWLLRSLNEDRDYEFAPYSGLRLVADRRPLKATASLADRRPNLRPKPASRPKLKSVSSDRGTGRAQAKPVAPGTGIAMARPLTQSERLDRLEAMLLRVAQGLEAQGRRKAG